MSENLLISLNDSQKIAAQHIDGPLLILAGAGSGKTKTITTRLAFLISIGIDPSSILTLTFTNKAATEMRERAFSLLDSSKIFTPPLLCTFHKFGLLFLKFHMSELERKNNFIIIDTDDKKRILKSINKEIPSALLASEVSKYKNSLMSPSEVKATAQLKLYQEIAQIYEDYENYLEKNNLVDFDDLLLLPYKILKNNESLAKQISQKYQYIMVDEYQDTNELQYRLLRLLCSSHNNLCVVGDDDQSIYGWRGATIKNILNFSDHFENSLVIKLEDNYRSTDTILNHANQLIEHNRDRLGKKLIGTRTKGDSIRIYESNDENDETRKIVEDIKKLIDSGENPKNIAILFRVNALSRSLEEGFNKAGLHYKLVGGMKFYERSEIKDLIAYFRILTNLNDNFSIKRIINKPKRGIGKTTIEKLEEKSIETGKSIFDLIQDLDAEGISLIVGKKNARTLKVFEASILDLRESLTQSKMRFLDNFEETFDYRASYDNLPDGFERQANIDEFYGYIRDYFIQNPHLDLKDFLNEIALESENDDYSGEAVSMMSVHASKGLEFKHLFIIGLEEGFFPITGDGSDLEEERRLGYVAITRAKDNLTLSFVHSRFYKGKRTVLSKSRFLSESGLIKGSLTIQKQADFKKGDIVSHKIFGIGRVEKVTSAGKDYKLTINFGGTKRDILSSFVEKA
ncbi:UvrD-helicase domain-containing protein [Aliarcobacter butzleri]|uniref:ATP-dependent helicase n=1 Tax=Aliarcobacter butzleri TaxID=28197 RepID=UPI00125ED75A|nr:UvrD-helicase domain-containing protein [Aliarcobacter butzleri]MCG3652597.1 UvrD-helicase domain-containing protein [Aliarcobacter butzleri]MCG3672847.1 UvrD-helicase domain-containing protein [Aliarcobacter butzleri]MCG3691123.1 UvrD-helicase domain-containing protein [Aliarcobacter butzleri]MDN5104481.1 UvrD-helicase domain-containing protein [Aliarcobacter butzleri]MDY0192447.1 UvrD-helicase domain-containing protein [Aliarcobacter butzleri]